MIVVYSSALLAILLEEPDADLFAQALARPGPFLIGAPTKLEFAMVAIGRRGHGMLPLAEELLRASDMETLAFEPEHERLATQAFQRFGKGQHRAALNFGDCMAYAIAKALDAPLLYKGKDFSRTDIRSALDT